ncbi:hypothetical protein H7R52_02235 [Weissella confusa]|uniref:DegV family protein n=1 Tax=Weissella confusa TaxID=1583 RepID=A0A923NI80_WEICO|nr:hypothetical protein [Weissella confusa]
MAKVKIVTDSTARLTPAYFGLQIIIAFLDNSRALAELTKPRFDEFVRLIKTMQDQQVSQYLLDIAERLTLKTPI